MTKPVILEINKSQIALYPIKDIRSVMVNVMIKGGSWYETDSNWGAFHFLEHLVFEGTKNLKDHETIENYKQDYGINNNAWTSGRSTGFWFQFPDVSLKEGFNLLNEMIFNSTIPEDKLAKEISIINQEYQDKWDSPTSRFNQIQTENLIGKDNVFCRDGLGQPEFLKTLTRENILNLKNNFYQPQNLCISVVGNFDTETVKEELSSILNQHQNTFLSKSDWSTVNPQKKYIGYQDDVNQSYLLIDWFLNTEKDFDIKTKFGINMFSYILGGSSSSLLFKKIRQELGLVYKINSRFWTLPKTNIFEIFASVDNKNLSTITENIKNVIYDFLNQPISQKDFDRVRHYMNLRTLMGYDSIYSIGNNLIDDLFYYQKIYTPEDKIKIADSIDFEEIKTILKEKLDWNNAYVSVMSPKS